MSNSPNRKNHNNNPSPDDDWIGELIVGLLKAAGYLLWWAILFPSLSIPPSSPSGSVSVTAPEPAF
ncbi:putative cell division protein FtsK/SpoIIIE [Mycobacterium intracellulare]|nr:putative cell division protein FtsK/SpoIIIE [Mycobacterium intracellulare]